MDTEARSEAIGEAATRSTTGTNKKVVERLWGALYAKDWDLLASLLSDEAHYADVPTPDPGGLIEGELLERLAADFARELDAVEWCNTDDQLPSSFFGHKTKRMHGLLARSPAFGELIVHRSCSPSPRPSSGRTAATSGSARES